MIHGLAASIRSAKENEVFDLGGQSATTISTTIGAAFAEPFVLDEMIRITLVTGAGKQARQKYDEAAAKTVVTALLQAGYQEDRAASGVLECAGSFKMQHDTGKNLKTVVVYPKVAERKEAENEETQESILPADSPGYKLAVSSMPTFQNMIKSKCPSWSQKKGCLGCLEALKEIIQSFDDKLMHGQSLTAPEQTFYDATTQLDEKDAYVRQESKQQVEAGEITQFEKTFLLDHNAERIKEAPGSEKLLERKELIEQITPIEPRKLKYHAEIGKLQKEIAPLMQLNDNQLLSVKERKLVTRREEILEEIEQLEADSRGWFEEDDVFESRLKASRQELARHRKAKGGSKISGGKRSSAADAKLSAPKSSKWITPMERATAKKKRTKTKGAAVFGAMSLDDSSSSEEEEESIAVMTETATSENKSVQKEDPGKTDTPPTSRSKKSKKKKKKGSKQKTDDEILDASVARNQRLASEAEPDDPSMIMRIWRFLQAYIFPLFIAILGWIVGCLFGKKKTKKN